MTSVGQGRPALLAPLLLAVLPSVLVLLVLPSVVNVESNPQAATALGVGEFAVPVVSAALAATLAVVLGGTAGFVLLLGVVAELPAVPGFIDLVSTALLAEYGAGDVLFWPVLLLAYTTLSVAAAHYAARWWAGADPGSEAFSVLPRGLVRAGLALGMVYLAWVVVLVGYGSGTWYHLLALCLAAAIVGGTAIATSRGLMRRAGWAVLIGALAMAAFAVAVEVSLLLNPPPPDLPDIPGMPADG